MNFLDRAVSYVAPEAGLRRLQVRAAMQVMTGDSSGAASASSDASAGQPSSVSKSWNPFARDAAADTLGGLKEGRGKSRDLYANNPIARGAIETNCGRVVGTGLALSANPNAAMLGWSAEQVQAFKETVQNEFSVWADSVECDHLKKQNFYDKQELTLRSVLMSADCFTLLPEEAPSSTQPYRLRLQTIEGDRVGNPQNKPDCEEYAGGVRRAANGWSSYFVYDKHPGASRLFARSYSGQWVDSVGASGRRRILHHYRMLRPEQPRGDLYLAPVMSLLKDLGVYTDAEVKAAVISSFFTVLLETEGTGQPAPVFGAGGARPAGAGASTGAARPPRVELGPGAVMGLPKGTKAVFADPSRPNPEFGPFFEAVTTQIGMALGIPRDLLIKRFDSSYSASRAAMLDAWILFRNMRTWLARSFCQPVYETWLAEAVFTGRVAAPGFFSSPWLRWAYCQATWHGDSMGSLNPKDEVAAYADAVDQRLITPERAEWELFGTDFHQTLPAKKMQHDLLEKNNLTPRPRAGAGAAQSTTKEVK